MTVVNAWSGALTADGFRVKAKVTGTSCRLAVSDASDLSSPTYFGPVTPTAQGIVDISPTGLAANTQWYWAIEEDGVLQSSAAGKSRTVVAAGTPLSFSFAMSTCAGGAGNTEYPTTGALLPHYVSNHPCFDEIRSQSPLFFMHSGDLTYYNITRTGDSPTDGGSWPANSLDSWRRMYDDLLLSRQGTLYRNVPIQYVWDNHDSAQPGVQDYTSNRHALGMTNASQVYRERVPSYPLAVSGSVGSIYHSFQIGRVLFIASDTRYNRDDPTSDPSPRAYLGSAQVSWMESVLSASTGAEYLVWQQTQDYSNNTTVGGQGWGMYSEERDQLVQLFGDTGWLGKMMTLCGDTHAMAMDSGSSNQWGGFPMFLFSSLDSDQNAGPNWDLGRHGSSSGGVRGQWGLIQVDDPGPWIKITVNGYYHT